MSKNTYRLLAFDLGAESGRAVLGTLRDGKLSLEEKHRFASTNGKINGSLQWNLLQQWEELKTGLRNAAESVRGEGLDAIGVDTWGVDFGFLGADDAILGNPVMYRDSRTDGMMDRAFAKVSREKIFSATGLQFMQFNTLYQLLYLVEKKSSQLVAAHTMLFMPDLFNFLFSGQKKAELSIVSTSQMYDPRAKTWAVDLLDQLNIPRRILPEIVPSGAVLGPLLASVRDECNAGSPLVIAPGCHDTASAVAAVPASTGKNWCYISSGTWSLMGVELDKPIINAKSQQYNYTNEMGVAGKVRFLKNIAGLWLVQECRRDFTRQGHEHSYAELTQMAADAPAFGPLLDPNHQPFLVPGNCIAKLDQFYKETHQRQPATHGEYIRSCLETLALAYRFTLERLEDLLGKKIEVIHIVGGGTKNELLNQMTASACGRTVLAGPVEATGIGNILVQAIAIGAVANLDELRQIVRDSFEVKQYEPADAGKWDSAYVRYRELLKS